MIAAGLVALALGASWVSVAFALERVGRGAAPTGRYDAIVVLGCRVLPSGLPSASLARRARRAGELWNEGLAPRVVTTGGVGEHAPSEASAAAEIARELGVPGDAIVLEERSTSTAENAAFARELAPGARRVLLVTDAYHAVRARRIFRRHFDEVDVAPVIASRKMRVFGALREVPALVIDLFRSAARAR